MQVVSEQVIQAMFNHLSKSFTRQEVCDILITKYPSAEGDIRIMFEHGYEPVEEVMEVVMESPVEQTVVVNDQQKLAAAVKQKVAKKTVKAKAKPAKTVKTKAPKAPKGASKMDRARELYANSSDKSRKAMMDLFSKELGLGKAAASTYFYSVKS